MFCQLYFLPVLTIAKVTVGFVVSDRIEQYGFQWTDLHGFDCFEIFSKYVLKSNFHSNITEIMVNYVKTNFVQ